MESYTYTVRAELREDGKLFKFMEETARANYMKFLNETEEWLYGDGANTTFDAYEARLQELQKVGEPVKQREYQFSEIPVAINQFNKSLEIVKAKIGEIDPSKSHITEEEYNKLLSLNNENTEWINQLVAAQQALQPWEDAAYTYQNIQEKMMAFARDASAIYNKPPPPPPKEEKKEEAPKEAPKEEPKDAEMKDESKPE